MPSPVPSPLSYQYASVLFAPNLLNPTSCAEFCIEFYAEPLCFELAYAAKLKLQNPLGTLALHHPALTAFRRNDATLLSTATLSHVV